MRVLPAVLRSLLGLSVIVPVLLVATSASYAAPGKPGAAGQGPIANDDRGVFSTMCRYSHSAPDDPIVHPGHAGMSHQHDFFGNVSTSAGSTYASLLASTSTCRAPADESAYWVPALTKDGQTVRPNSVKVYYRALGEQDAALVEAFPAGFRMIAGDATAISPQQRTVTRWTCHMEEFGGASLPPTCSGDGTLDLHVSFPECWNGELDSVDHKSHMAYGGRGPCPASHSRILPKLEMIVHYPIDGSGDLALASGSLYSAHADFFNAWAPARLQSLVSDCLRATERCGAAQLADRPAPRRPI